MLTLTVTIEGATFDFIMQVDKHRHLGDPITREEALAALDVAEGKR